MTKVPDGAVFGQHLHRFCIAIKPYQKHFIGGKDANTLNGMKQGGILLSSFVGGEGSHRRCPKPEAT